MPSQITPQNAHDTIDRYLIADGFDLIFDYEKSQGSWIVDARDGTRYLDAYGFFASLPCGFNHPALDRAENRERLLAAAQHKPTNSDADSVELARFVHAFANKAMPAPFRHLFFIEGGALAVENALKAAFDWKVRKNLAAGRAPGGNAVLHFRQAFHGRSGYTMSLTNTDPTKVMHFPQFDWPRVHNPSVRFPLDAAEVERVGKEERRALDEIDAAFAARGDDIAAIIIEPIQGEGGDNHFRPEFLAALRRVADEREALLIFDEVQTGFGATGKMWCWQHFDVVPDLVSFGKKTQVCGVMAGPRLDEVEDNVFRLSSRINSTWGGGLVDMVRCQIILEVMHEEGLVQNAADVGAHLLRGLTELQSEFDGLVANARGRGLFTAFDLPSTEHRRAARLAAKEAGLLVLASGERSLRLRPALTFSRADADEACERLRAALRRA